MKKLLITLTALALSATACAKSEAPAKAELPTKSNVSAKADTPAKTDLPFVGERLFAMAGGQVENTINISQDGTTTITAHHARAGEMVEYQGNYQEYMPYQENGKITGYYHIKGNQIHLLDENKNALMECGTNQPAECVAQLESVNRN